MAGGPTPRPSSASERKKLIEEYEQAKRSEAQRLTTEQATALRRKRITRPAILAVILALALYLAFSPPSWLQPPIARVPTAAQREAGIRFAVFLQAQQIEHFRATRGRLPGSLAEAGSPLPGIRYHIQTGTSYELASEADSAIRYTSSDSLHVFLGGSMAQMGRAQ